MMTPFDYYEMLVAWKDCTPLRDISLVFDEQVYAKAVKRFAFDYVRWYGGGGRQGKTSNDSPAAGCFMLSYCA